MKVASIPVCFLILIACGSQAFATGARCEWHNTSFLRSEWAFRNKAQQSLVIGEIQT